VNDVDATGGRPDGPGAGSGGSLRGVRVALTESREIDRLARIFETHGAVPVRCPLVATCDAADPGPVDSFLQTLAARHFDCLVLLTGEGLRRLVARATTLGIAADVREALAGVCKVTRGPKPARALGELGLAPDLMARTPTTSGLIEALRAEPLRERQVGVQLAGDEGNQALVSFLGSAGASVTTVAPYRYVPAAGAEEVLALVSALADGTVDAIAFTSARQVERLFAVAEEAGVASRLRAGLARACVAAVGPVSAHALLRRGVIPQAPPRTPFVMPRLVAAVRVGLAARPRTRPVMPPLRRLAGRRIALPENRELDRLAAMMEAEGAIAVRCPLMSILDAPDQAPIEDWLRALVAGQFDDVIFLTGEGAQRLVTAAARAGLETAAIAALRKARKITRGPKPARVLHQLGLSVDIAATPPTSRGVMDGLRPVALAGRRIGLQLFGDDPSHELVSFLETRGAAVAVVAPYRYAPASDDSRVQALVDELANGAFDAIAFTTALQIERLFVVARGNGREAALAEGLARTHVAAVGPIVAETLQRLGVRVDAQPERQFFMRRLTDEIARRLGPRVPAP
jgi:uroporphyrinogen-III synthase